MNIPTDHPAITFEIGDRTPIACRALSLPEFLPKEIKDSLLQLPPAEGSKTVHCECCKNETSLGPLLQDLIKKGTIKNGVILCMGCVIILMADEPEKFHIKTAEEA